MTRDAENHKSSRNRSLERDREEKGWRGRGKRERLKEVYGSKVLTFSMMFLHLFEGLCSKYRWLRNLVYSFTVPMLCISRFKIINFSVRVFR